MRQWVLTLPDELRRRIAYDRKLLATNGRIFVSSVLGFYRRRLAGDEAKGSGKSGAVVVVQRRSSDLKLTPHFDAQFLDGVYRPVDGSAPVFTVLPRLAASEVVHPAPADRPRAPARSPRHTVRYRGVLAAAATWRSAIVPAPASADAAGIAAPIPAPADIASPSPAPPTHRSTYRPFVELLRPTFAIDLGTCDHCRARTKVIALVRDSGWYRRVPPPPRQADRASALSPARAPPYFQSRVARRRPAAQGELGSG